MYFTMRFIIYSGNDKLAEFSKLFRNRRLFNDYLNGIHNSVCSHSTINTLNNYVMITID